MAIHDTTAGDGVWRVQRVVATRVGKARWRLLHSLATKVEGGKAGKRRAGTLVLREEEGVVYECAGGGVCTEDDGAGFKDVVVSVVTKGEVK